MSKKFLLLLSFCFYLFNSFAQSFGNKENIEQAYLEIVKDDGEMLLVSEDELNVETLMKAKRVVVEGGKVISYRIYFFDVMENTIRPSYIGEDFPDSYKEEIKPRSNKDVTFGLGDVRYIDEEGNEYKAKSIRIKIKLSQPRAR